LFNVGAQFGSGVGYNNGTTFMLQPGIYLVQLSIAVVGMSLPPTASGFTTTQVSVLVNNTVFDQIFGTSEIFPNGPSENVAFPAVNGNELLQITGANTVVGFNVQADGTASLPFGCRIIFTRLQ
jgi:hypothetical protein